MINNFVETGTISQGLLLIKQKNTEIENHKSAYAAKSSERNQLAQELAGKKARLEITEKEVTEIRKRLTKMENERNELTKEKLKLVSENGEIKTNLNSSKTD
ncbi:3422_t:CDS:2 [Entrophospora sp. SA101]|nr:3422_t:CDS:2 [Entrophospora sp. SA101]